MEEDNKHLSRGLGTNRDIHPALLHDADSVKGHLRVWQEMNGGFDICKQRLCA